MNNKNQTATDTPIAEILKNTTEENQHRVDWTRAWSTRYPVLKTYQKEVDIEVYASQIRQMFAQLQTDYGYTEEDAMLVLKDILAHEYMDHRPKKQRNRQQQDIKKDNEKDYKNETQKETKKEKPKRT